MLQRGGVSHFLSSALGYFKPGKSYIVASVDVSPLPR